MLCFYSTAKNKMNQIYIDIYTYIYIYTHTLTHTHISPPFWTSFQFRHHHELSRVPAMFIAALVTTVQQPGH